MSDDATPTTTGGDTDTRIAALEQRLAAYERSQAQTYSLPGPRTDLPERWGPRVRIGLIEEGRYMAEVLAENGDSHGMPKLIGEPFQWLTSTLPPLSKWLDGDDYAQDDYPELFAVLSTTFNTYRGAADPGAGRFRVPNWEGLFVIGLDPADGSFNAFTDQGGSKNAVVVSHTHTDTFAVSPAVHDHDVTTGTVQSGAGATVPTVTAGSTDTPDSPTLTVSGSIDAEGVSGIGANLPPYCVARYAIFAGR